MTQDENPGCTHATQPGEECAICALKVDPFERAMGRAPTFAVELRDTMRHARVFITSREKMHPTGVEIYDELLERLERVAEMFRP